MTAGDGQPKAAGTWDWYGSLDPAHTHNWSSMITFSIGIFQWVSTKDGTATKKGKVLKRITGYVSNPEEAYEKARAWIDRQPKEEQTSEASQNPNQEPSSQQRLTQLHQRVKDFYDLSGDPRFKEVLDELSSILKEQP